MEWLREYSIRKQLGGYYPEDPIKADFFGGIIAIQNKNLNKHNNYNHLQDLIRKNK